MKRILAGLFFLILTACGTAPMTQINLPMTSASLPDLGPAPELTAERDAWLNVDSPLRLADLAGKVVAIDMWTFG
jgi:hypothetical protein